MQTGARPCWLPDWNSLLKPNYWRRVESNAVFVNLPESVHQFMREKGWNYHIVIDVTGARLMCSWDTTEECIGEFIADLEDAFSGHK